MPLYPYRCTKCGYRFEKIQRFNAAPETHCPQCGGALERPLTAPGLQFKGAGWYVTDYASKGSSASEGSNSSSTASETKPGSKLPSSDNPTTSSPAPSTSAGSSDAAKG